MKNFVNDSEEVTIDQMDAETMAKELSRNEEEKTEIRQELENNSLLLETMKLASEIKDKDALKEIIEWAKKRNSGRG